MFSEADMKNLIAGYKQTMKALKQNKVQRVYIAEDCEDRLSNQIEAAAMSSGAEILYIDTMRNLGELCKLELKTSCACILK